MNKKIISAIILTGLLFFANFVFAQTVAIPDPLGGVDAKQLLKNIASGIGVLIASLGTIMIIVAGIFYLTSAGSPEKMAKAKTTLTYAIVGIAVGISAKVLVDIIFDILKKG